MKLTIITINRNNAEGLAKTLKSINQQTCKNFEHVVVDGASTDNSVDVIRQYEDAGIKRVWISESDSGIYNAMNKGIRMASGEYLQFLNSGDMLAGDNVVGDMLQALELINEKRERENQLKLSFLTGGMLLFRDGKRVVWRGPKMDEVTFETLYKGSVNHSPTYIKKDLFEKYGMYDESLRIVSDWKFFLEAIVLHNESIEIVNQIVTIFDLSGISSTNLKLRQQERSLVLNELFPKMLLKDLEKMYPVYKKADRIIRIPGMKMLTDMLFRLLCKYDNCYYGLKNKKVGWTTNK